ncbi:L-sorbose 1-dehydrogenase-like isoform X2 [Dermacentor albipictus]
MDASTCFLNPQVRQRSNLHILTRSTVTKIIFDQNKRVTGVVYIKDGIEKTANVSREVVVCAGAIGSPKLLMLSGIGPKWHLEQFQIPVLADLNVGQGLQDHVVFAGIVVTTKEDLIGLKDFKKSFQEYMANRTGLLTIPGGLEALLFTHSDVGKRVEGYPDLELEVAAVFPNEQIAQSPYVSAKIYEQYYKPMIEKSGFLCALAMVQPEARGAVYLNATDPNGAPSINPNMLGRDDDLNRLVYGTLKIKTLFDTAAMKKIGAKLWERKYPRCKQFDVWSEPYVRCMIQQTAFPGQHVCCTCAMGNNDKSVLDARMRVRGGVQGLRVIDASAMPKITAGNTNAAVMMMAAKGAAMILEDAKKDTSAQS